MPVGLGSPGRIPAERSFPLTLCPLLAGRIVRRIERKKKIYVYIHVHLHACPEAWKGNKVLFFPHRTNERDPGTPLLNPPLLSLKPTPPTLPVHLEASAQSHIECAPRKTLQAALLPSVHLQHLASSPRGCRGCIQQISPLAQAPRTNDAG